MTLSMHSASVPVIKHILGALDAILDKAAAHAGKEGLTEAALLEARLAPDMYPLSRQVQIATDMAKGCVARLAGRDIPSYPDVEKSFAELKARIARTLDFVASVPAEEFDGSDAREVVLKIGGQDKRWTGETYLMHFALPNFFFHATTAYDILRKEGLPLGKPDFLGGPEGARIFRG